MPGRLLVLADMSSGHLADPTLCTLVTHATLSTLVPLCSLFNVPDTMCDLQLVYVDMSNNALDGTLPSSWGSNGNANQVTQKAGMLLVHAMQIEHTQ